MKNLALAVLISCISINIFADEAVQTHSIIMKNFQNDDFKMTLETKNIEANDNSGPGLYFTKTKVNKGLNFDSKITWENKPNDKESVMVGEYLAAKAQKNLPIHIAFHDPKAKEAAEIVKRLLKSSPDKLQFSFSAVSGGANAHLVTKNEAAKTGKVSFQALEFSVPEDAVTIKNLKTGHFISLTDYIDAQIDRSTSTALKSAIRKIFGKKRNTETDVKDTSRRGKDSIDEGVSPGDSSSMGSNAAKK